MKTNMITAALCLSASSSFLFAQVGINTTTPQSTLDVNGNMKIRQMPTAATTTGFQILAVNQNTGGDFEVTRINPQLIADLATQGGVTGIPASVYSSRKTAGVTLFSATVFPTGFQAVNFMNAERTVGASAVFTDNDNTYNVPSTGIYEINYTFRYGQGLFAQSVTAGVGIVRTRNGVSILIDARAFMSQNLGFAEMAIAQETLNGLYPFQAGDKISFGLTNSTTLNPTILGASTANFNIAKVSN
ncbi:hypothetical protein [uncultured Chryseobacterium sp.]|uniref:hypothetical protein n=1 Tax=uncultured Chryseobacterium sp. TaxID=259322 RepID=UPI0025EA3314|nr:hypothetical protein [uncultured Chryseobacterium sp.]